MEAGLQAEISRVEASVKAALQTEISKVQASVKAVDAGLQVMRSELRWMRWLLGLVAAGVLIPLLRDLFGIFP